MKTALILLMPDGFRDEEFLVTKRELEAAGVQVKVAGLRPGPARGMLGEVVRPNLIINDVEIGKYDALVIPGGGGSPMHLWNDNRVHALIRDAYMQGKVVAAICLAVVALANAGVLKDKKATVFETPESLRILREKGCDYQKKDVVVDGRVVTAEGPRAAEKFAGAIIQLLL